MARERECLKTGCSVWPVLRILDDRGHFIHLDLYCCDKDRGEVFTRFFGNGLRVRFESADDPNAEALFRPGGVFEHHTKGDEECGACFEATRYPDVCAVRSCVGRVHYEWARDAQGSARYLMRRCDRCARDHTMARP